MSSLVSICIPTYNGSQFIAEALDSAIAQTYSNIEIVVSDDASIDDTLKIIETYKAKTNIPIHIYHHAPKGIGANWNHCIQHAKGEYIKFLFQDDVLLPSCLDEMVKVLENDNSIGLVASKRTFIIENHFKSPETEQWIHTFGDLQKNLDLKIENGLSLINYTLFKSKEFLSSPLNKIGEPSTFMFRKKLVNNIGYFREDVKQILDYEFCYRILLKFDIGIINKPLVKFRLHELQATHINKNSPDSGDGAIYHKIIYRHYLKYLNESSRKQFIRRFNFFHRVYNFIKRKLK